ncbi:hypothetical protein J4467_01920 [Candidatus Woesearchaeota archaeon]|nr:hypothetical protein [Candidatus Woesearchaeota archaeon]
MKKVTLVFSDIEVGTGNNTDDFVEEKLFCDTLKSNFHYHKKYNIDLVLNGDIFDFLKAPYKNSYPRHVTEKISLWKLEHMHKAHPGFFETLTEFINLGNTRIIFVIGNHDYDIIYSKIKKQLRKLILKDKIKMKKKIIFPGFEFKSYQVLFEHGSQMDQFFRVDPSTLIHPKIQTVIEEPFLLVPWGFNALKEHLLIIKEEFPILERVFPKDKIINKLNTQVKKRVIFDTFFYMLKSFFYTQFRYKKDKLYNFTWNDFKKYMRNFLNKDYDLKFEDKAEMKLLSSRFKVISYGHNHLSSLYKIKGKYILNTTTWRDEYEYSEETKTYKPLKKSYGFILHDKQKVYDIKLIYVKSEQKELKPSDIRGLKPISQSYK